MDLKILSTEFASVIREVNFFDRTNPLCGAKKACYGMDSVCHDEVDVAVLVTASNQARVRRHAKALNYPLTNEKGRRRIQMLYSKRCRWRMGLRHPLSRRHGCPMQI